MTVEQLDLFADLDRPIVDREGWADRFERAPWVAPWDCSGGLRKGDSVLGWVCPACGRLETNTFALSINHGYDPSIPGRMAGVIEAFGATCTRLMLLTSQERARASKAAREVEA